MTSFATLLLLLSTLVAADAPYPDGSTSQEFDGLRFQLVVPNAFDAEKAYSLFVILHGYGGTETGMASSFQDLTNDDFIVCAPKSTGDGWSDPDLVKVRRLTKHLQQTLSVGKGRTHGLGFSNGGWNLAPVVFDEGLGFASACWMAAGYKGGSVPKKAKKTMGAIALAGAEDPNLPFAQDTVKLLQEKVRSVECRVQPELGHEFPQALMPYYYYWLKVMDGRFTPGIDESFDWTDDVEAARQRMAEEKLGGFLYFFSKEDDDNDDARAVQQEVFFDPLVRHYGEQLAAVKLDRAEHDDLFQELRLKKTPAVVVLKKDGKTAKSFSGGIKAGALAKSLRGVAPNKKKPKR